MNKLFLIIPVALVSGMFGWLAFVNFNHPQIHSLSVINETIDPSQIKYLNEINFYRIRGERSELKSSKHLKEWAEKRACEVDRNLKEDKALSHRGFYEFVQSLNYQGSIAENIASKHTNENVITAWYISQKHREALMNTDFNFVWVSQCNDVHVMLLN